jgi:hypothetical protein
LETEALEVGMLKTREACRYDEGDFSLRGAIGLLEIIGEPSFSNLLEVSIREVGDFA